MKKWESQREEEESSAASTARIAEAKESQRKNAIASEWEADAQEKVNNFDIDIGCILSMCFIFIKSIIYFKNSSLFWVKEISQNYVLLF